MDWVTSIHQAIQYIEEHLREELNIREIAQQAALSPFYFQKGFAMLCDLTVGDYIRQRRLSAAGLEVLTTDRKIIDIALEFGYDSPDSFTKAFTRFHGLTPTALQKEGYLKRQNVGNVSLSPRAKIHNWLKSAQSPKGVVLF